MSTKELATSGEQNTANESFPCFRSATAPVLKIRRRCVLEHDGTKLAANRTRRLQRCSLALNVIRRSLTTTTGSGNVRLGWAWRNVKSFGVEWNLICSARQGICPSPAPSSLYSRKDLG